MNKEEIKIIDIRKHTGSKSKIVNYEDGEIIFAKDYWINDKYYYSIKNYSDTLNTVEEIYKYEIPEFEYTSQYSNVVGDDIIIIKMHLINKIEVDILDKNSKELKSKHSFQVNEEVTSIPIIINSRYFIFYTDIEEMNSEEYIQYKEKGYYHFLYLCDLVEDKIHLIRDLRIVKGITVVHSFFMDCLPTFIHNNQEYLIFNETYMDDYEYELDIYEGIQSGRLNRDLITVVEALYTIGVDDFAEAIKLGEDNIPFKEISKRYVDGWVRYLEIDEKNIYFREKDFKTQIEKIYAMNKASLQSTVVAEINHKDIEGRVFYGEKIYEEVKLNDHIRIRGLHNCNYDLCFKRDKNVWFEEFINDRYVIDSQWIEDEEDNCFKFVYITDVKENKCIKYDGTCKIYNDCVIIYDNSGY